MIRFGTDGWRATIADEFTFDNVRVVAQATADQFSTITDQDAQKERTVFIGYDVRFLSDRFARAVAEVFAGNGFGVLLMDGPCPTPYVSYQVRNRSLVGGIVITASHNPASFNGFKVKASFGGSAPPEMTAAIESRIDLSAAVRSADSPITLVGPEPEYTGALKRLVDWDRVADSGLRVVVDSMHGSGGRVLETMLAGTRCDIRTIRANPDPLFGGISPEPMMPQLEPLCRAVVEAGGDIGLATDGDADRLGVVSRDGRFMSTLEILPLLLLHLHRKRGWRGAVAHTFSQSQLVGRIGRRLGLEVVETPIGFKNIAALMLERPILIGGEESGGVGVSAHLPERDGVAIHLLLLDLLAASGQTLEALVRDMWDEFGEFHYDRRDLHVPVDVGARLMASLVDTPPSTFARLPVASVATLDGVKLLLEPDAWILFRRSGTEPVLRLYAEAPRMTTVSEILEAGLQFVEQSRAAGV